MFKKSPLKATRLHKHKRRVRIIKLSTVFTVLIFVIGILAWLSHLKSFALDSVVVTGNIGVDSNDIQTIAEKDLAGSYLGLFAKSNSFLFQKNKIENDITHAFPSISNLQVSTKAHVLEVNIAERKPAYEWCTGMPASTESKSCFFMDENGFIFSHAPQFSGNAYFIFYGGLSTDNPIGMTFLSPAELKSFAQFKSDLDLHGITIVSLLVKDIGVREVYLLKQGKIIYKEHEDPLILAASIELLKRDTKLFNLHATSTLEYIDLRFGNKVYYKFIGDNPVQTPS
jgi:hypothetical protein